MFFYLKPPRGNLSLNLLEKCVAARLKFFLNGRCTGCDYEYLIFGSSFDRASHFLLRLFVATLSPEHVKQKLIEWETCLFLDRLESVDFEGKLKAFRILNKHIKEVVGSGSTFSEREEFAQTLYIISQYLSSRNVCSHVFLTNDCDFQCSDYIIQTSFTICPILVKTRQVALNKGIALVPCRKWKTLLKELFSKHIYYGIQELIKLKVSETARRDARLMTVFKFLNSIIYSYHRPKEQLNILRREDLPEESRLFPPCMFHLYQTLLKKHRLSHQARFYFSLFLKDIGMPVQEALNFWEEKYSQPYSSSSSCSHSWQKNSKKYIYGINHLYGLEGGRKKYPAPSCKKIQIQSLTANAEDGCPFLHFDDRNLAQSLSSKMDLDPDSQFYKSRTSYPLTVCQTYLSSKLSCDRNIKEHHSPVEFYSILKKNFTETED